MKLALISDLHANRPACEAVLADIEEQGIERIACLGDIIGYGPEPEWCIDQVMARCEWSLMGNHDEALFAGAAEFNTYAREALVYTRKKLRPRGFMLVLVGKDGGVKLRKPSPWTVREITRSIDKFPDRQREVEERRGS